jgi:hypothetical protein
MRDNRDNCDAKGITYRNLVIKTSRLWPERISSSGWIMWEWFVRQVEKAEEMYRRAIADKSGIIV